MKTLIKKLNLAQATSQIDDYIKSLGEDYLILNHENQPVAALMSIDYAEKITNSFNSNPKFMVFLEKIRTGLKIEENGIFDKDDDIVLQSLNPECSLAEYVHNLGDKSVIFIQNSQPLAVLMPIGDADMETVTLSLNPDFIATIQESRARLKAQGGISLEALKQELGLA